MTEDLQLEQQKLGELEIRIENENGHFKTRVTEYQECDGKLLLYHRGDQVAGMSEESIWTFNNNTILHLNGDFNPEKVKKNLKSIEESHLH